MEKQISFSEGLVNTPYSDVSPDGQCSMLHNLEVHAGSVRPSVLLGSEIQLGGVLKFIHKTGEYTHYLYKDEDSESETFGYLMYKDAKKREVGTVATAEQIDGLKDIAATGNVLTFLCDGKELVYGIWDDAGYTFLGAMPDLDVSFALEGDEKLYEDKVDSEPMSYLESLRNMAENEDTGRSLYEKTRSSVEAFVDKYCNANNGGFVYPFFVRAAWKLYDGTYTKFTEPVLMIPNTKFPAVLLPQIYGQSAKIDDNPYVMPATYLAVNHRKSNRQQLNETTFWDGKQNEDLTFGKEVDGQWQGADVCTGTGKMIYMETPAGEVQLVENPDEDDDRPVFFVDSSSYVTANVMKLQARIRRGVPEEWKKLIQGVEIMVSSPKPSFNTEYIKPDAETGEAGSELLACINETCGKVNSRQEVTHFRFLAKKDEHGNDNPYGKDNRNASRRMAGRDIYVERVRLGFDTRQVADAQYNRDQQNNLSFTAEVIWYNPTKWDPEISNNWLDDELERPKKFSMPANFVSLQDVDAQQLEDNMDRGDFYHYKTIEAQDIQESQFVTLPMKAGQYSALVTQTDRNYSDTWSNDKMFPNTILEYNSRINLSNLKIKHFVASDQRYTLPYIKESGVPVDVYVRIYRKGITKVVKVSKNVASSYYARIRYLFVPNPQAVGYIIVCKDQSYYNRYVELPLKKSTSLDGAYYFNAEGYELNFDNSSPVVDFGQQRETEDEEDLSNYIYTSEVDNPFKFTSSGVNRVGSGAILKVATMTKPLSEGQMGGFPLVAFCEDGNYALSVIKTGEKAGLYESATPMRSDVCINADSILGIEEGIFFVSQRGLMLLTENDALLLTEKLDGPKDVDCKPELSEAETQEVSDLELEEEMPEPEEILVWLLRDRQIEQEMFFSNTEFTFEYLPGEAHHTFSMKQGQNYRLTIGGLWCDENDTVQLTIKLVKFENGIMSVRKTFTETVNHSDYIIENWEWEGEDVDDVEVYFGVSTQVVLPDNQKESPIGISVIHVVGRNEPHDEEGEEEFPWIDPDTDPLVVEDGKEFDNLRAREYIEKCMPAWDYTNSRLLLVRRSYTDAYVMKADDKTWSTIELPEKVKKVINSYPFSYIQFEDNKVVVLDDDYNFSDTQHDNGVLVTRPIKMDSLQLKRVTEFAVQGNYSDKQRLTLWGSNDLKRWFKLGTTERRRVGAMRGYYFKYWRMSIETHLKENENISGVLVRYTVKDDGRFR